MNSSLYSIEQINQMSLEEFVATLGEIWEQTPAIARKTWYQRAFKDLDDLYQQMLTIVNQMTETEQLALIKAHPDLGSKAKMAQASVEEQTGAGLNSLSEQEYDRLLNLNQTYKDKFGFPFIIAVKYHNKESILQAFVDRLQNDREQETQRALTEISTIARLRLESLIS